MMRSTPPKVALCVATLLLSGACGGRGDALPPLPRTGSLARGVTLPPPTPAAPAFRVETKGPLGERDLKRLKKAKGVAVLASYSMERMRVRGPAGAVRLRVAQIDPIVFRSITPVETRDADFVWGSMILGGAVPTFEAARQLGLELDGPADISIAGTGGFQVSAFADSAGRNFADVLVQRGAEKQLQMGPPRFLIVGAKGGASVEKLGEAIRRHLDVDRMERLIPQAEASVAAASGSAPATYGQISGGVIGAMRFEILKNGFIRPDPAWVAANIATATMPILGSVTCHRLLIPRLVAALTEVEEEGLSGSLRPGDYGGCYVPRFIDRDPSNPLSRHAFGLAVDLNVSTNHLGPEGDMDPEVVAIFQRWGFTWGGHWSRPDPMHFEI